MSCQKFGIILENNVIQFSITKNVLLSSYYSFRKIGMIFYVENWLWNSNFGTLWYLPIISILKIQKFPLSMLIFRQKSFQFCTPRLKTPQPVLPYSSIFQEFLFFGPTDKPTNFGSDCFISSAMKEKYSCTKTCIDYCESRIESHILIVFRHYT